MDDDYIDRPRGIYLGRIFQWKNHFRPHDDHIQAQILDVFLLTVKLRESLLQRQPPCRKYRRLKRTVDVRCGVACLPVILRTDFEDISKKACIIARFIGNDAPADFVAGALMPKFFSDLL